ncbi:MAG: DNRLRE domain-containing protein, partial [Bacteroidota bacterium]
MRLLFLFIAGCSIHLHSTAQSTLVLQPVQDNTLYESIDGSLSNGAGNHIFAGKTGIGTIRRALLQFDFSSLPSNAVIQEVSLEMNVSKSAGATTEVKLYTVRSAWGEGTSDAAGPEGMGTTATNGDATWLHTSYPDQRWSKVGGDRLPIESAITTISGVGKAKWNDKFMAMDIQGWLEEPEQNFGWMIVGEESIDQTANRFDSRESDNPPILQITYILGDDDDNGGDDDNGDDNDDDDNDDNDDNDGDDNDDDDNGGDDDNGDDNDDD